MPSESVNLFFICVNQWLISSLKQKENGLAEFSTSP
jgi:hypothetical protein